MNRLFLSILFALPAAAICCAQQPVPPPQPNVPHNRIFQSGWLPQAKTPAEYQAYARAAEVEGAANAEKSAEEFATAYPDSELRYLLYSRTMRLYQEANQSEGTLKNGRRVLALHQNDPVALVMIASVLAEHTSDTDPDREARFAEAIDKARRAINNIDTALILPPHTPTEQILQAKSFLLSAAHSSIGLVDLLRGNNADAESELHASLETGKADPSPLTWLRLALAQEHEKNYTSALASINQAMQIAGPNTEIQGLARQEREHLLQLSGGQESHQASVEK